MSISNLINLMESINSKDTMSQEPIKLIDMLINNIDTKSFKNPDFKILDLCCGSGKILLRIIEKLDHGLRELIPNDFLRRKHIFENQIFAYDINYEQILIFKAAISRLKWFVNEDIINYNINTCNTLEKDFNMKFDIIIANPPYQLGQNSEFYMEFVEKAFSILNENGIMKFITPNRVFMPNSTLNNFLKGPDRKLQKLWWNVSSINNWNIGTFVCAWDLIKIKNGQDNKCDIIVPQDFKNIDLNFPISNHSIFNLNDLSLSILNKYFSFNDKIKEYSTKKKNDDDIFICRQWRRWNSITKSGGTHCFNFKNNEDGRYFQFKNQNEKNNFLFFIESFLCRYICFAFSGSLNVPPFLWSQIPNILNQNLLTENEIFNFFNITEDEIKHIKEFIK